jgi:tRNA dimethylallyltransferase
VPIGRQEPEQGGVTTRVLFIVGPTAVGKTRLAAGLAQRFNGEIINADSRQVYRQMDVGTAKPSSEERGQVPHHLMDILDPDQSFDVAAFLSSAHSSIQEIQGRDHLPVVAGGTGQYVWALAEGWLVPRVPPDPVFRRMKQQEADQHGPLFVYRQLQEADPERAALLDPRNVRRVVRALEVHRSGQSSSSGSSGSSGRRQGTPLLENGLIIGLTMDRQALYRRIDDRVDHMLASGLLEEVKGLAAGGHRLGQGPLSSPGYRELGEYLAGELSLEEAVQRTKYQTHRLARRQYTWFKLNDARIHWLDAGGPGLESKAALLVQDFLRAGPAVVQ